MFSTTLISLLALGPHLISAAGHGHNHAQFHDRKRSPDAQATKVITVEGPTVIAYEYDGQVIPQAEVCQGIKNGTLELSGNTADDKPDCSEPSSVVVTTSSTSTSSSTVSSASSSKGPNI